MIKLEKKQIKIFSIAVALVFIGSVVAIGVSQLSSMTGIASAASSSTVGVIDFRQAFSQSPALADADAKMKQAIEEAKQDFETKSASMNEEEKGAYYQQTQQRLSQRQQELIEPVEEAVRKAAKEVADAKGLTVVIDKGVVVYGGNDITQDVIAKIQKGAKK